MRNRSLVGVVVVALVGLVAGVALAANPGYKAPVSYLAGDDPFPVAVADFDRDGRTDIAVANENDDNVSIYVGQGKNGKFKAPVSYLVGDYPFGIVARDLNGDKKVDLAVADYNSASVATLKGVGDGTFKAPVDHPIPGASLYSLASSDVNRDGDPDLVAAEYGNGGVHVLIGSSGLGFEDPDYYPGGSVTADAEFGDVDGDGKKDIVALSTDQVDIMRGRGNGTFRPAVSTPSSSGYGLAVADFNSDGRADVAISDCDGGSGKHLHVSLAKGSAFGLRNEKSLRGGSCSYEFQSVDFNKDGKRDIALSNESTGKLDLLAGKGDGTFRGPKHVSAASGEAYSAASGRFNSDKFPDFVVPDFENNRTSVVLSK